MGKNVSYEAEKNSGAESSLTLINYRLGVYPPTGLWPDKSTIYGKLMTKSHNSSNVNKILNIGKVLFSSPDYRGSMK